MKMSQKAFHVQTFSLTISQMDRYVQKAHLLEKDMTRTAYHIMSMKVHGNRMFLHGITNGMHGEIGPVLL